MMNASPSRSLDNLGDLLKAAHVQCECEHIAIHHGSDGACFRCECVKFTTKPQQEVA